MRPLQQRRLVGHLREAGLTTSDIAYLADIPRSTVRDWLWFGGDTLLATAHDSCERCGHAAHDHARLPEAEYALLLGFYLGDGTISRGPKGVYRLRIVNDNRYPAVTAECAVAVAAVMPASRVGFVQQVGCVEVTSYSRAWPCVLPYYGPGTKHTRRIELTDWQVAIVTRRPHQFIRGLLLSDGCRIVNFATTRAGRGRYEYPRYFFSNASDDIRALFCAALDRIGVEYTQPKPREVSIARRDSVRLLDSFVGPKA